MNQELFGSNVLYIRKNVKSRDDSPISSGTIN